MSRHHVRRALAYHMRGLGAAVVSPPPAIYYQDSFTTVATTALNLWSGWEVAPAGAWTIDNSTPNINAGDYLDTKDEGAAKCTLASANWQLTMNADVPNNGAFMLFGRYQDANNMSGVALYRLNPNYTFYIYERIATVNHIRATHVFTPIVAGTSTIVLTMNGGAITAQVTAGPMGASALLSYTSSFITTETRIGFSAGNAGHIIRDVLFEGV